MLVRITSTDIRKGKRRDCRHCPVKLALDRTTGRSWMLSLTTTVESRTGAAITLPPEVSARIGDYDAGRPMTPFSFQFPWCPDSI